MIDLKRRDMSLVELMKESHETAVAKGWWEGSRNIGEMLALMHSELSEALEEYRVRGLMTHISYREDRKPCGFPIEIADLLIRVADMCEAYSIPIVYALELKLAYNKTRPYRHGNKLA